MAKHGEASDTGVRPRGRREVVCGIRRHVALALQTALLLRLPVFDLNRGWGHAVRKHGGNARRRLMAVIGDC